MGVKRARWWSLPRARGFTATTQRKRGYPCVSPPCAGVYRRRWRHNPPGRCLSPVRGGLPPAWPSVSCRTASLPRARGFTGLGRRAYHLPVVSPPCAGVYRLRGRLPVCANRLSPVRGGLPEFSIVRAALAQSLPRARGFTFPRWRLGHGHPVSPPCAGVYRRSSSTSSPMAGLSPVRGGLPICHSSWRLSLLPIPICRMGYRSPRGCTTDR